MDTPKANTKYARRRRLPEPCFGILKEQAGARAMRDGGQSTRSAINIPQYSSVVATEQFQGGIYLFADQQIVNADGSICNPPCKGVNA